MAKVLNYPETVDYRMDDRPCRVTVVTYTIQDNIKPAFQNELINDHLYQVEVLGISDREFLVLQSQLSSLEGDDIVILTNLN